MLTIDTLQQVFAHIDAHKEQYLQELFTLIRQPSVSARGEGLKESADLVCDLMVRSGFPETRVLWGEDNPCPFGRIDGPPGTPTVLIYGHHDVQPPEPLDQWLSPPFEPTIRNGRIYARGSADNKGQMSAHLFAVQSLRAVLGHVPVTLKCIFDGQEESTSPHLHKVIEQNRERLQADLLFWADGPFHESGRPLIYCGVRGILTVELFARGANRNLHSGNWGGTAPNAANTLIQLFARLKGPDGRVRLPGYYDRVRAVTPAERAAVAAIPWDEAKVKADIGVADFDAPRDMTPLEKLMFFPTCNVAGISSGYTGPGFATIIPHEAVARIDFRLVADQDPDEVLAALQRFVAENAPGVEVRFIGKYYPHRTDLGSPYIQAVADGIATAWGEPPIIYPSVGGSAPDSLFARGLGVPTMLVPYANPDETNHAPNENMRVDCFIRGIKTSAAIFYRLAQMGG